MILCHQNGCDRQAEPRACYCRVHLAEHAVQSLERDFQRYLQTPEGRFAVEMAERERSTP